MARGEGHVDDLVAGYVLGALDGEEKLRLESHLTSCEACSRDVEAQRRTATLLAFTAPLATPPSDVKVALFARIAQSQAQAHAVAQPARPSLARSWSEPGPAVATPTLPASRMDSGSPVPASAGFMAARRNGRRRVVSAGITGSLVMVVGILSIWSMSLRNEAVTRADQINDLRSQLEQMGVTSLGGETGGDAVTSPADGPATPLGWLINPPDADKMLVVSGVEDLTEGIDYDVYAIHRDTGAYLPAGELRVDGAGIGTTTLSLGGEISYAQVCVAAQGTDPTDGCQVLRSAAGQAPNVPSTTP